MIYRIKITKAIKIISGILMALCIIAAAYCVFDIFFNAKLAVDYFSNAFIILLNFAIILCLVYYVFKSGYKLNDEEMVIKTAFFKDLVCYRNIKKIYFYATEEELYLHIDGEPEILRININKKDINIFVNELKKRVPDVPYEVSLKTEIDSD